MNMHKCDFCSRGSRYCYPNSKECKQATERYFQYNMAQIKSKSKTSNRTYNTTHNSHYNNKNKNKRKY